MKARIDQERIGEVYNKGIEMQVIGRIKGANRATKKVIRIGKQGQQDRRSRIELGEGAVNTKYGTLGIKVKRATERRWKEERKVIVSVE